MTKEKKSNLTDKFNYNFEDAKPFSEIEYLEYLRKNAKTVNSITYPDGSIGEFSNGIMVIL